MRSVLWRRTAAVAVLLLATGMACTHGHRATAPSPATFDLLTDTPPHLSVSRRC